ncbi:hypothetical protein ACIBO5_34580 [Nonomuraea angiospora]|uniref:hypothetical protein n=1 Tax=Nonomuraea angiospora TaxID=46172 RepID=UPI0037A493D9
MLRLFGLTGRNIFLAVGTTGLIIGGFLTLTGEQVAGASLLQIALIAMLGAIACAITEHQDKRN